MVEFDALIRDLEYRDRLIQHANFVSFSDDPHSIKDFAIPCAGITATEGALTEIALEMKETNKILKMIADALIISNKRENEIVVMKLNGEF